MTPASPVRVPSRSWLLLALLFAVGLLNYLDRQTLSILKSTLRDVLSMSDTHYSWLIGAFMAPYIIFYIVSGRLVDRFGTRISLALFVGVWSIANIFCGFATSIGFLAAGRMLLGAAEPGAFPAIQRVMMTWFPVERRAFAWSLLSPCTTVGAIIAPPLIAWLAGQRWGWHGAFILPGMVGLLVAVAWWFSDKKAPVLVSAGEKPEPEKPVPMKEILRDRRVWLLLAVRLITDPVWYFLLFWLPGYLQDNMGLTLKELGWVAWIPSFVASMAVMISGRTADYLVGRGKRPIRVRVGMFIAAACFAPVGIFTTSTTSLFWVLVVFSIMSIVCQIWFFGQSLLVADVFPKTSAATMAGLLGAVGASGGMLLNMAVGPVVERFGYLVVFAFLALLHPLAAVLLRKNLKQLERGKEIIA